MFDCKPLAFIWEKFADYYNEDNTIMMDDLRRNYVMNPQNGLVIRAYKHAHIYRETDKELLYLTEYLERIANKPTLSKLNHRKWMRFLQATAQEKPAAMDP